MVNKRQSVRRTERVLRAEEYSEIAVNAINRHITISINGTLKQKTIIQSLVGMSVNKLSVHSMTQTVEKIPCETSVRHHLSKVRLGLSSGNTIKDPIYSKKQSLFLENCIRLL
jgi:hypothetical protein